MAVVSLVGLKQTSGDSVEVKHSSRERGHAVNVPVSQPIAYHGSSQWDVVEGRVEFSLQVVLVDLPSEVRDVDSSITFSTNKELVSLEFRELFVPDFECSNSVLRLNHIVGLHVLFGLSERVADSSGTLKPDNVSLCVPGVGVVFDYCLTIIHNPRSVLLHETKH